MASITIDNTDYDIDDLSEEAKQQLMSLQFVQGEIKRLDAQLAVYKTASIAYSTALKNILDN
tara:strand:+ start:2526 stop:2711 length:186 start_codon:yes stop_codon:yes gene_type:complete